MQLIIFFNCNYFKLGLNKPNHTKFGKIKLRMWGDSISYERIRSVQHVGKVREVKTFPDGVAYTPK